MTGPNDFHLVNGVLEAGLEPATAQAVAEAPKKRGPGRPRKAETETTTADDGEGA